LSGQGPTSLCLDIVANLLNRCDSDQCVFPPTDLYNEGWLLRIILDWFSHQGDLNHKLSFSDDCNWYSEALLPSQFLARFRGDPLSETWTHADGIIGHIKIGRDRKTDTTIGAGASHLVVTEAKMFSKLSAGLKNASYFNQAARYAACIAVKNALPSSAHHMDPISRTQRWKWRYIMANETAIHNEICRRFKKEDYSKKFIAEHTQEGCKKIHKITLEDIISNNNILIGFCDVVIDYEDEMGNAQSLLIEVKSSADVINKDSNDVLRQIKKYIFYLKKITKVFLIYSGNHSIEDTDLFKMKI
jgi:hypothetical protein